MQTEKLNSIQQIMAIGTAAALIISCINLNFYWYTFGINIFDYLSISEILARSAFPIILTSGTFIGILAAKTKTESPKIKDEAKTYLSKYKEQIVTSLFFIILSTAGLYLGEFKALSSLSIAILILLFTTQRFKTLILYLNKASGTPTSLLIAIISIIALSGSYSLGSAINIKEGTIYYHADVKTKNKMISGSYIGRSDSRVFLWRRAEKQVVIINQQNVKNISLKQERNLNFREEQTEPPS